MSRKFTWRKWSQNTWQLHELELLRWWSIVSLQPIVECGLRGGDEHELKETYASAVTRYVISSPPLSHKVNAKDRSKVQKPVLHIWLQIVVLLLSLSCLCKKSVCLSPKPLKGWTHTHETTDRFQVQVATNEDEKKIIITYLLFNNHC